MDVSWLDGKRKAGPTKDDFKVLQSSTAPPANRSLDITVEEAFTLADKAVHGHVRKRLLCITNATAPMSVTQKERLPFQVFNELDAEFFRSVLKGNVSLGWSELPTGSFSRTSRAGRKGNPRIRIEFSPFLLTYGSGLHILAALVHQMTHAYYLQCCGFRDSGHSGEGHDLTHEQPFQALLKCVGKHCEPLQKVLSVDLWLPRWSSHNQSSSDPTSGASCCYGRDKRFNDVDIQDWCDVAVAKTESLHEAQESKKTGASQDDRFFPRDVYFVNKDGTEDPPVPLDQWQYPREAYIFLNFDGRDYPVPRSHVSDLAALTSSPHFEDRLFLHLPQGTSEGDFLTFYFFLFHGAYPPHLKVVNSEVIPYGSIQRGPPRIKPYEANAPTYLIGLITAYTLGKGLQYQPFCDFVVQGLYSLQSTAEDPIQVLEKIYRRRQKGMEHWAAGALSEPPDAQLRLWTKNWLTVELLSPDMGQYGSWFKTNRGVLRSHRDWSGMYAQLLAFSKELREDDEAAAGKLVPRKDNSDMLRVTSLPPAPETPMYRQGPSQLPHPSVIARQFMPPTRLPSAHQAENIPSRSGETLSFLDLSGLSQYLPDQFQQRHPEVPLRSVPSPLDTEAYGTWRVPEEGEMLRRWRELQKPDPPFNNIFDQRAPPGPEQPPRPF